MNHPFACSVCNKGLSRKSARLINGKIMCSLCMFPRLKRGIPQSREQLRKDINERFSKSLEMLRDTDAARQGGDAKAASVPQDQQAGCVSNRPKDVA